MKLYPVKGKVVLEDGKPLTSCRIVFVATGSSVSMPAPIENDGTFNIKGNLGDGLPEGDYKIRIEIDESKLPAGSSKAKRGLPFPQIYTDEDSSKLTATVTSDAASNNFEFKLTKTPPGQAAEPQGRQR